MAQEIKNKPVGLSQKEELMVRYGFHYVGVDVTLKRLKGKGRWEVRIQYPNQPVKTIEVSL